MALIEGAQHGVHSGLITFPPGFEPLHHVSVKADCDALFFCFLKERIL